MGFHTPVTVQIEAIPCPACGGTDYQRLSAQKKDGLHPLLECRGCSLVRMEEIPLPRETVHATDTTPVLETFSPLLEWLKTELILKPEIRRLRSYMKGKGPVLDVGCGTGWATAIWRDHSHMEVHGMELEPLWADMAAKRFGLHVLNEKFENASIQDGTYEMVIFRHVLEHFLDPAKILRQADRILKPGGYVLIIVPNGDSLGRRIFRQYWEWAPPSHIYNFSPRSLSRLLQRAGFLLTKIFHSPSPVLLSTSLHNWLECQGRRRLAAFFHDGSLLLNSLFFPLAVAGKIFHLSEVITVLARKAED